VYRFYRLAGSDAPGEHVLRWTKASAAPSPVSAVQYLVGAFDVRPAVALPAVAARGQYLLQVRIPAYAAMTLSRRRRELRTDLSWAEQGQPFYSGGATYRCEIELPVDCRRRELYLPRVECIVEASWNGRPLGLRPWSPYVWELPAPGRGELALHVRNTLANQLEGYRAASGLTGGWKVRCF